MKRSLFLDALACRNSSRPPIWLMRQAGRHLASYRAIRCQYTFLDMCHQPDLITKITLLPIDAYDMDAAILFSDILVVPEAMGLKLQFVDKIGPIFENPLQYASDIQHLLPAKHIHKLNFVAEGIKQLRTKLQVPLIGFCGAPFTVASYMIEGRSSRDLKKTKEWMFQDPQLFHRLLDKIADWSIAYLKLQIEAGVQAIQIFDSWANFLAHHQFREFSLAYLERITYALKHTAIPVILFCKGASVFAPQLAELQPAGIGLDWNCQLSAMRKQIPSSIALQGNLDPDILHAPIPVIEKEATRLLDSMQDDPGFIFNLGHGLMPDVPEESVRALVNCIQQREVCHVTSSS